MLVGKKKISFPLVMVLVLGIVIISSGLVLKALAARGDPVGSPGDTLSLVQNLYYRQLYKEGEGAWQVGEMDLMGRFYGGYVVGLDYCVSYEKEINAGKIYYRCKVIEGAENPTGDIMATGFGMLYQENGSGGTVHILIQLSRSYLPSDASQRTPWGQSLEPPTLPWFDYVLTQNDEGTTQAGHNFVPECNPFHYTGNLEDAGRPCPVGYKDFHEGVTETSPDGYISIEERLDVE